MFCKQTADLLTVLLLQSNTTNSFQALYRLRGASNEIFPVVMKVKRLFVPPARGVCDFASSSGPTNRLFSTYLGTTMIS